MYLCDLENFGQFSLLTQHKIICLSLVNNLVGRLTQIGLRSLNHMEPCSVHLDMMDCIMLSIALNPDTNLVSMCLQFTVSFIREYTRFCKPLLPVHSGKCHMIIVFPYIKCSHNLTTPPNGISAFAKRMRIVTLLLLYKAIGYNYQVFTAIY